MALSFLPIFILLAVPVAVSACEGECIVEITKAFNSNYTTVVRQVLSQIDDHIDAISHGNNNIRTPHSAFSRDKPSTPYSDFILNAYKKNSYTAMENAIFPGYFHGKCQRDGVEPPGCPNPDCPVVCGTPGSLVHFYSKLRFIAFNATKHMLEESARDAYNNIGGAALANQHRSTARMSRISRTMFKKRDDDTKQILLSIASLLEKICGGTGTGTTNGLPDCSWEKGMKAFILSFP